MSDPTHDEDARLVRAAKVYRQWYEADYEALDRILTRHDALMEEHKADDPEPPRFENYLVPVVCTTAAVDASPPHSAYVQAESPIWTAWNKRRAAHDKVEGLLHVAPAAPVSHDGMTTPDGEEQT